MAVAKWLQNRLEHFRLPAKAYNDINANSRYIRPVFRDQADLNAGILGDELRRQLENSKFLILVCSKNSANSSWVSDEARAFVEMGRLDKIIPLIISDGTIPEPQLFPVYLRNYFSEHANSELLGINLNESGKEKSLIKVVSKMLDVSFDSLWNRHLRRLRRFVATAATSLLFLISLIYFFAIPVTIIPNVNIERYSLPIEGSINIRIDGSEYSAPAENVHFDKVEVPGYKRFSKIDIKAVAPYFSDVDTVITTGFGLSRNLTITLKRDDTFAKYRGIVYDELLVPLESVEVEVAGRVVTTDSLGRFCISLPVEVQRRELPITLKKEGYKTLCRPDETPGGELKYIMHLL